VQLNKFKLYMPIVKLTLAHGNPTHERARQIADRLPDRHPDDVGHAPLEIQQCTSDMVAVNTAHVIFQCAHALVRPFLQDGSAPEVRHRRGVTAFVAG